MVKSDIESLFCHLCNIYEYREYTEGSVTKHNMVMIYHNMKCRLSYSTGMLYSKLKSGQEKTDAFKNNQSIKLFLPADVNVKAGCRIEVFHQNITSVFVNSSDAAFYKNHTEILLDNNKEWA